MASAGYAHRDRRLSSPIGKAPLGSERATAWEEASEDAGKLLLREPRRGARTRFHRGDSPPAVTHLIATRLT